MQKTNHPCCQALKFLYEDENIVAVNKPAGLLVYLPAGKNHEVTLRDLLTEKIGFCGASERSGIVHRLDKETSGVILIAKNKEAEKKYKNQFKLRKIKKEYLALVWGDVYPLEGAIEIPLGRDAKDRLRVTPKPDGKFAKTIYKKIGYYPNQSLSLLRVKTETGRMHQIRVHLSAVGYPIVGDKKYAKKKTSLKRHFLHAEKISFKDPFSGKKISIYAKLPKDLESFLKEQK